MAAPCQPVGLAIRRDAVPHLPPRHPGDLQLAGDAAALAQASLFACHQSEAVSADLW